MSISQILTTIDEYKDLAIECALQQSELVVKELAKSKAEKLEQIMILISILQKDAVISELNKTIRNLQG